MTTVVEYPRMAWYIRVASLEQLSVAEFSGEQTRPKVYENGHKMVLGIWLDLVLKVKYTL